MRGLTKESSELSRASLESAGGAEARKRFGSGDEGVVGVKVVGRAAVIVETRKHLVKELFGDDVADVGALALAMTRAAVGVGVAAKSVVAATHPLDAQSAASLPPTFAVAVSTSCQQQCTYTA